MEKVSFIQTLCFLRKALKSSSPLFTKYLIGVELGTFGRHFHKDWQTKPFAAMEKTIS
jgi:hypothetical protein